MSSINYKISNVATYYNTDEDCINLNERDVVLGNANGIITDDEMTYLIVKDLEHEHIHRVLWNEIDPNVSKRFDLIAMPIFGKKAMRLYGKCGMIYVPKKDICSHYGISYNKKWKEQEI